MADKWDRRKKSAKDTRVEGDLVFLLRFSRLFAAIPFLFLEVMSFWSAATPEHPCARGIAR